jgi:ferric-dicitrate binding protein FerR (iron transport regulator)
MMRGMYADFLDEAASAVDRPELTEHAAAWREIADQWTALADAALPDAAPPLAEARDLLQRREQTFLAQGANGLDEVRSIDERLAEIQTAMETDFPLDESQSKTLLNDLRDRLLEIHAAEVEAAQAMAG